MGKGLTVKNTALLSAWAHNTNNLFDNNVFRVNWHLGNTCTFKCSYCDPMLHDGSIAWPGLDRSKELVDTILDVYSKRFNKEIFMFELTGGEPTVYPHIDEFSKFLKQRGIFVSLCTNGSRSLRWWDEYGGNFTSITNSYHPEFTDVKHLTAVCNLLRLKNVDATSLVLLDPNNYDKVKNDLEYMRSNGNFGVYVRKVYKRNEGTMETRDYTEEQLDYLEKNSYIPPKLEVEFNKLVSCRTFWIKDDSSQEETNENRIIGTPKNNFKGWSCYGGIDTLSLDMRGYIFPAYCPTGTDNSIGNWRTDDIKDIKWPEKPMICNSKCTCVHDVKSRKIK